MSIEDKSNNELISMAQALKTEHEVIKMRMVNDYDKIVEVENQFAKINKILTERNKHV